MSTSIVDRLLQSLSIEDHLIPFLKLSGWTPITTSGEWTVLQGENDYFGNPIELVFPASKTNREDDYRSYAVKAVELISALNKSPLQITLQNIINYDRDILYARNIDTGEENAVSITLASRQVSELKNVLEYSCAMDKNPKPFIQHRSSSVKTTISKFLFGHTIAGSFGYMVESSRMTEAIQSTQLSLFEDIVEYVPDERRIMERVVRGLNCTKRAEAARDHAILINEFLSGFNSNMCESIVEITENKKASVEYRIVWSPKVKPGDDIAGFTPTTISDNGYELLAQAADELKKMEPVLTTIKGHVKKLECNNTSSLFARRVVVIRGDVAELNRTTSVIVELEPADYDLALKIHGTFGEITIQGFLSRSGSGWRLLEAKVVRK